MKNASAASEPFLYAVFSSRSLAILFGLACYWCLSMTFYDSNITANLVELAVPSFGPSHSTEFNSSSNALFPTSILTTAIVTLLIVFLDIKSGFTFALPFCSSRLLAICSGLLGALGTTAVILVPVFALPLAVAYAGSIALGCSAAVIMLYWGSALSRIPSKTSYVLIPAAFFLGCLFLFGKSFLTPWGIVAFDIMMPVATCLFWALTGNSANPQKHLKEPAPPAQELPQVKPVHTNTGFFFSPETRHGSASVMLNSLFANIPWRVALLFICCSLIGAFIERLGSMAFPALSSPQSTWITLVASALLMTAVVWGIVIKGKDFLPVWLICILILMATLVIVPAMGWISPQTQVLVIVAEKRCLIVLIWVFLVGIIFRGELPVITTFGAGHIALQSLPNFLGQAAGEVIADITPHILGNLGALCAVMAVILVIALAFSLFDSKSLLQGFYPSQQNRQNQPEPANIETAQPQPAPQQSKLQALAKQYGFSPREQDIIKLLVRGHTFTGISDELGISLNTVRTHSRNIYKKLDIHTKQELIDLVEAN